VGLLLLIIALVLVLLAMFAVHIGDINLFYLGIAFFIASFIWGARGDFPRRQP
jgi:hypothetical protein